MLPAQSTGIVGLFARSSEEDLGGDDDITTVLCEVNARVRHLEEKSAYPAKFLDDATHFNLRLR